MPPITARDGLIAYSPGDYARRKLEFIDYFCPVAIDATEKKVRRVYVDLFAGPGLNVLRESAEEIESGALRVLGVRGKRRTDLSFTHAHLVNLDPLHDQALRARVATMQQRRSCMLPPSDIEFHQRDANEIVSEVMRRCHSKDYVLVFADIEAPRQLPWTTIQALKAGGHESVDLYMLFPLEMGLNRLTDYGGMSPGNSAIFTQFYGGEEWREILQDRVTPAHAMDVRRRLEELYLDKLRGLWNDAVQVMQVRANRGQRLYRMLFATSHAAGKDVGAWARKRVELQDQGDLFRG